MSWDLKKERKFVVILWRKESERDRKRELKKREQEKESKLLTILWTKESK